VKAAEIEEFNSVGSQVVQALDDWPKKSYCAVFGRPSR
jgi:hypothetical protein